MDDQHNELDDSLIAYRMMSEDRLVPLRQVGISGLEYPLSVWDRTNKKQRTIATIKMAVDLPKEYRSTHRSRLISALERHTGEFSLETMPDVIDDIRNWMDAERAHIRADFPYFVRKRAPKSGAEAAFKYKCWFVGDADERNANFTLGVEVPVTIRAEYVDEDDGTSVSQCEAARVRLSVRFREMVWMEELVECAELCASSEAFTLLKREDEIALLKQTEENPVGVEDIVRRVADRLTKDTRVTWFYVEAEAESPLRNHCSYAAVGSDDL